MRARLLIGACALAASLPAPGQAPPPPAAFLLPGKGHCLACHQLPAGYGPESRADVGPRLEGQRMRSLGRERLRAILEDPTRDNPATVMPPFGRHLILEPGEIRQIVEYLHALP